MSSQIHEYMLSKAPAVPQLSPPQASEEASIEESEAQVDLQNPVALPAGEGVPDQAAGDRVVEELPVNANPDPTGIEASKKIPPGASSSKSVPNLKPETRVQKPDDRLFTLAAIVLTIAIMDLLLKNFFNSTVHGATLVGV